MSDSRIVLKQALDAIELLTAKLAQSEGRAREPIAVVGMGCRLPGGVNSPADYWKLLREGQSGIREVPADRWDIEGFYDPDPSAEGKSYTRHGGFLDGVDGFDASFFGISHREALTLDPQQRLLLECAWEALEEAGEAPDRLTNSLTGVYVGITTSDYARLLRETGEEVDVYSASGTALNAAAGRISFTLGLQGPSVAIDTACSSSLVAAHTAAQALRAGECDMALVGGVNVMVSPAPFVLFSKWGMISPSGECRTFDAGAIGFVRGEGCGVLVLKRLRDALAHGNRVLAVIRGSAVNQDGPSSGLSVPNGPAQEKVMRRALENAGLKPGDIGFVEAHGTGTALGDPIEVEALGNVYGTGRPADRPLLLGSVKPSIGHLESAAGAAGLMKLVLTVQHGEVPAQLNFDSPNPRIEWERYALEVADHLQPFPSVDGRRIGAVSGFGFSGTNVHMIVEGPPPLPVSEPPGRDAHLLPLSARTEAALRDSARRLANAFSAPDAPELADAARTLALGRAQLPWRAVVVGADRARVRERLEGVARGEVPAGTQVRGLTDRSTPRVAFLFTGQGSQYPGMGLELARSFPVFHEALDRCDVILRGLGVPLLDALALSAEDSPIHQTGTTQPAIFALEYALTELLRSWGITPAAVLGHSVGEYTAACIAGVFSLEDGLRLIADRARLMQALPTGGGMLAVATDADVARESQQPYADRVSLAALNGPTDLVLSGDLEALAAIDVDLRSRGIETRAIPVSHAFHSPLMEPMLDRFEQSAASVAFSEPRIPLVSNLTGSIEKGAGASADYWRRHIRQPVAYEASIRHLVAKGFRTFVELGPRPVLISTARRFLADTELTWIPTLRARDAETEEMLECIGALFTAGTRPEWEHVLDGGRRISLPTYPFQRRRHWVRGGPASPRRTALNEGAEDHPLLGGRVPSPLPQAQYQCPLDPVRRPVLAEHRVAGRIILPASAYIELGLAAGRDQAGCAVRLERGELRAALVLDADQPRDVQAVVTPSSDGAATFEVFSRAADATGEWTSHAAARVVRALGATAFPEFAASRAACTDQVDIAAYQERMRTVGLEYGPSFHALVEAWRGGGAALGELRLPESDELAARVGVHPGLLDAAFHLIGLALPESAEERFLLPIAFELAELTSPVGMQAKAHVSLREADDRHVVADVTVWRKDGAPALRVQGLTARAVTREQFLSAIGESQEAPLLRMVWTIAPPAAPMQSPGRWLVAGASDATEVVVSRLRECGAQADGVPDTKTMLEQLGNGNPLTGLIDLRPLGLPGLQELDATSPSLAFAAGPFAETLALFRGLAARPPTGSLRIIIATRHAQAVGAEDVVEPLHSAVWGATASAAAELSTLDLRLVDIGDVASVGAIADVALRNDREDRVAVRGEAVHVARLRPVHEGVEDELLVPAGPYALTMRERGTLEGLGVEPIVRRGPGPGEVEIEVLASGLNFRDVLNLLDMYPGPESPLGNECCGHVVAVGDTVDAVRVGDLVTCIAEATFASHVVARADLTFPVPTSLSVAQAAAFPIAQLTAWLALHEVGGIQPGDSVLVHAGAGGVGLAAIQLALAEGAEVLATAGSPEKRDYLRSLGVREVFDSRRPLAADRVREASGGRGVDLLLNSLTGEFIDEGLRSLAPGGRFLEIGLRELRTPGQVAAVRPDVSYHTLLLGDVCRDDPGLVRAMYERVRNLLETGRIPPPRTTSFPMARGSSAFRFMGRARHIGRIAITHPRLNLRGDASYLVSGGMGAIGLHVAEWLAERGANHVILLGRSKPSGEAMHRIEDIRAGGTTVEIVCGDVAHADALLRPGRSSRPPLRGFAHAAGTLDDALLHRVDPDHLERALRPKADGALALSRAADSDLEFFALFSSGSALLGSPGQTAYAAANAFLDGFAHRLRAQGRPAVSVNWGAWADGGMAAEVDERIRREWTRQGLGAFSTETGLSLLEQALTAGAPQLAALAIDWRTFLGRLPLERRPPLLAEVAKGLPTGSTEATTAESLLDQIAALPSDERLNVLTERLRREAAAVFGAPDPTELELHAGLMEQGMDSLMAVELGSRIGRLVGVSLPATFMFEYPTLAALALHLVSEIQPAQTPAAGPGGLGVSTPPTAELDELSDDELEAELRRELDQAGF